jgi:hypothetical protein
MDEPRRVRREDRCVHLPRIKKRKDGTKEKYIEMAALRLQKQKETRKMWGGTLFTQLSTNYFCDLV